MKLWRVFLIDKGMSENTVRKHTQIAKQFFTAAVRRKLITDNPFADLKSTVQANPERFFYVSPEMMQAVLDACPDDEWRLIVALCRYGGLRCPSEVQALQWSDINWEKDVMTVHSCKTEHHAGGASRVVPLFPELRPYLDRAFDAAEDGAVHVVSRYHNNANLRTRFHKIIRRAGLDPWPKLFQNLRSTRQTELVDQGHKMHVVCRWIGNSLQVAAKHYLQMTEQHLRQATQRGDQKAQQTAAEPGRQEVTSDPQMSCFAESVISGLPLSFLSVAEEGLDARSQALRIQAQVESASESDAKSDATESVTDDDIADADLDAIIDNLRRRFPKGTFSRFALLTHKAEAAAA